MIPNNPSLFFVKSFWTVKFKVALEPVAKVFGGHGQFTERNTFSRGISNSRSVKYVERLKIGICPALAVKQSSKSPLIIFPLGSKTSMSLSVAKDFSSLLLILILKLGIPIIAKFYCLNTKVTSYLSVSESIARETSFPTSRIFFRIRIKRSFVNGFAA